MLPIISFLGLRKNFVSNLGQISCLAIALKPVRFEFETFTWSARIAASCGVRHSAITDFPIAMELLKHVSAISAERFDRHDIKKIRSKKRERMDFVHAHSNASRSHIANFM